MTHVQRSRYVRRRNHDREDRRVRILVYLRRETAALFPARVVFGFGFLRIVSFGDVDHSLIKLALDYSLIVRQSASSRKSDTAALVSTFSALTLRSLRSRGESDHKSARGQRRGARGCCAGKNKKIEQ